MWKIQSCKVGEFCILLYYERKSVTTMWKCGNAFSRVIQKYTKFANFTLLYFQQFTIFATKLHNFTKFGKLFPTVLKLFTNLKVCLIGELSIHSEHVLDSCCFNLDILIGSTELAVKRRKAPKATIWGLHNSLESFLLFTVLYSIN